MRHYPSCKLENVYLIIKKLLINSLIYMYSLTIHAYILLLLSDHRCLT